MQGNGCGNPIRLVALLTCLFFLCSFINPGRSHAASIENLDEMIARKARYTTNPWPTSLLEDPNNNYIWQPETLCYTDVTTGREVWVLTHAPDTQEFYSKEPGTNVWSYDGSRIGFFHGSYSLIISEKGFRQALPMDMPWQT